MSEERAKKILALMEETYGTMHTYRVTWSDLTSMTLHAVSLRELNDNIDIIKESAAEDIDVVNIVDMDTNVIIYTRL